jgi:hypothetical protein
MKQSYNLMPQVQSASCLFRHSAEHGKPVSPQCRGWQNAQLACVIAGFEVSILRWLGYVYFVSLSRRNFMSVFAPTGEIFSFASPKESIQRKGDPNAAYFLRSSGLNGVFRRGFPAPTKNAMPPCIAPKGLIRSNPPVLGAASGD